MKKILSLFVVTLLSSAFMPSIFAQGTGSTVIGLPYKEIHAKHDVAMPYQYVREADVMWSKIVWRRIELSEKRNHILYEPTVPIGSKASLIDVILEGIETKGLTAFKAKITDAGNEFDIIMKEDEINQQMGAETRVEATLDQNGNVDSTTIEIPYNSADVKSYLVKELWFFDKQRSVLDVRIIGICPIREYFRATDPDHLDPQYKKLFWVYYPEVRPLLAESPVYNPKTDVSNLTYDDIFQKRFFSSFVFMESNPYNRIISEYESGLEALLEGERVKEKIFNFEQDLWEY